MMRLLARWWLSLGLVVVVTGCTKQCFLSQDDFNQANHLMPPSLESDPNPGVLPVTGKVSAPAIVDNAERPPRYLSLQEAVALALENGTISDAAGSGSGLVNDRLLSNSGGSLNVQSDRVRVLALNPAISAAAMEQSLARFDAQWVTAANWSNTDSLQQGLNSFQNGVTGQVSTSLIKAFASGGVAGITFNNNYQMLKAPPSGAFSVVNPLYTSALTFSFEQPLWRDYGVEINQLLNRFPGLILGSGLPGSALASFNNKQVALSQTPQFAGTFTEGILISRIRFDSARAEFERNIHNLVLNVEVAYWKLYQAYGQLYSFEEVMRIAHKVWMNYDAKVRAGSKGLGDFAPVRGQYEEFRGSRVQALGAVLEAERNLRGILGLPVEDGCRLVPVTPPTLAPFQPNWDASLDDALRLRPELVLARENLRIAQLNLVTTKNFLKPDLRFGANYSPTGFGNNLGNNETFIDGAGTVRPANAWNSLSDFEFNSWNLGLVLNVPIGYRLEHAAVRVARLSLAQSYEVLKDQEDRTKRALTQQYQKLAEWHRRIQMARAEREAYAEAVNVRFREIEVGRTNVADGLLEVQRRLATAMAKEFEAISEYNNSLARFEWAKGSLLQHNNIVISEGGLPVCTSVRAVEHERERTKSLLVCQRPSPFQHPGRLCGPQAEPQHQQTEALAPPPQSPPVKNDGAFQDVSSVDVLPPAKNDAPQAPPAIAPKSVETSQIPAAPATAPTAAKAGQGLPLLLDATPLPVIPQLPTVAPQAVPTAAPTLVPSSTNTTPRILNGPSTLLPNNSDLPLPPQP